jgi:hypothetical protein
MFLYYFNTVILKKYYSNIFLNKKYSSNQTGVAMKGWEGV